MDQIIGHEKVKQSLAKMIQDGKVGHAYLFFGKEGIGKKMVAMQFAKQIMHLEDGIWNESDFHMVEADQDMIKVEEIRKLIAEAYLKPVNSKHKVIVIDEADKMNVNAQNALLKVLEEPPSYITIILIVSNKEKILKTVLSRTTEITFQALTNDELEKIVGKEINCDYARGSASRAFAMLEGEEYQYATALMQEMNQKDFLSFNRKMTEIKQSDADIVKVLEMIKMMYYQKRKEDPYAIVSKITLIDQTIKSLNQNANTDLALDKMMIEMCRG